MTANYVGIQKNENKGGGDSASPPYLFCVITLDRKDRKYGTDRRGDQRSNFERDRDRVLYCSAFRRLAGVTQVVHAAEGHVFHNRLTHTIKVAQVGRRLAEHLVSTMPNELIEAVGGIDPSVVETACLAHDLGHPPFGHIAEEELDKQLRLRDVADGYEGNAQSFRIVTQVAIRNLDHSGLNLTRASLNAILKYPWDRKVAGKEYKKWGYYFSEKEEFEFARALEMKGDVRQSAEAALMDWADDVAYSVHDVDDFYRAGLIPLDQLLRGTVERDHFLTAVFDRWGRDNSLALKSLKKDEASEFFERLSSVVAEDLQFSFNGTRNQRAGMNFLTALLIRRYILGVEKGPKAVSVVSSDKEPRVQIEPRLRAEVDLLKELMVCYVFEHPALVAQQYGQRRVIRELFEVLFEAAQPTSLDKNIIPPPFSDYLADIKGRANRQRARLVADFIASLTEQQALLLHQRLMGIAPGSVRDLIVR